MAAEIDVEELEDRRREVLRSDGTRLDVVAAPQEPRGEGVALSCALFKRLAGLGVPMLAVAEYNRYVFENAEYGAETHAASRTLLACAAEAGFATLSLQCSYCKWCMDAAMI